MDKTLHNFTFSLYRLTLEATERIELTRFNKGITLRGAFGSVFRRLVCHDLRAVCHECEMHPTCPYGFIFTPMIPPDAERLRLNMDIPRPFVIKPPLDNHSTYPPGDTLCFDLVVVGRAQDFLPYFIVTFEELGRQGIGVGRGRYRMAKLEGLKDDNSWEEIYDHKERMVRPPRQSLTFAHMAGSKNEPVEGIRLRFVTPVLLKEKGQWAKPDFGPLMKRLRDRTNALSYFYCGEPLEMDFREFGNLAEGVRTVKQDLQWVEEKRYARHRDIRHLLKGYVGEVEFEGDLGPFMPMLRIGEFLHVGKATAFGQGWYRIRGQMSEGGVLWKRREQK